MLNIAGGQRRAPIRMSPRAGTPYHPFFTFFCMETAE